MCSHFFCRENQRKARIVSNLILSDLCVFQSILLCMTFDLSSNSLICVSIVYLYREKPNSAEQVSKNKGVLLVSNSDNILISVICYQVFCLFCIVRKRWWRYSPCQRWRPPPPPRGGKGRLADGTQPGSE